ncbi:MAG TPA: ester cyclase [Bryobacteraceae bacterium]|nr:ester cyclase [Bryobacteraceae bacterium]
MTENDNVEYATKQIAALNARDLDGYLSRIDESYVGQSETAPGPIQGREGVRQNLEGIFRAFPDLRIDVEQIIATGDSVVARIRMTATHKGSFAGIAPTNKSIALEACNVLEIRDGKAIRGRLYADNATLFQQLGALSLPRATAAG